MPIPREYVKKDGTSSWRVRLRDPVRHRFTSETFATRKEAEQFCKLVGAVGAGKAIRMRDEQVTEETGPTVNDLFEGYLKWKATRVRSDRTVADYRRDYDNWIREPLGGHVAFTVTEQDVQGWVESMVGTLAAKTVVDRHSLLHGVYGWGVRTKVVLFNPCIGTELPKRRKSQPKGLRPAEWQALHIALRQIDADAADLAHFLVASGWRFSEAAALSAFDVEDYGAELYVTMSQVVRRNAAGQHKIVEDGKSEESMRRIKMSTGAAAMIRRRMERVSPGGLVFTTKAGAQWHHPNFNLRAWKPAVEAAGLSRNPTPHWLRHSQVFWLSMSHEATIEEIQRRVGHEHYETTMGVYGSMISDVSDAALDALDRFIGADDRLLDAGHLDPPVEPARVDGGTGVGVADHR